MSQPDTGVRALGHFKSTALLLFTATALRFSGIITVTTTADRINTNGQCSLREAIINANNNQFGSTDCASGTDSDTIVLPDGHLRASQQSYDAIFIDKPQRSALADGGLITSKTWR